MYDEISAVPVAGRHKVWFVVKFSLQEDLG